jgi:hypothetical protein
MEIKLKSIITCPNCGHKKGKQCQQMLASIFMNVKIAKQD